jgi:NAD(P)-dependent dehydrogenase (short-subunit alcohol dehydrogenase family)
MALLDGKVAFITGAASGIGRAAAVRFAREGANVAIADTDDEDGEKVRREMEKAGGRALFVHCDVSDAQQVKQRWTRPSSGSAGSTSSSPTPGSTASGPPSTS